MSVHLPDHLDLIASAPEGIKKLRGLIYELAARGKLIHLDYGAPSSTVQLGDVAEFVMGQAPPGSECNTDGIGTVFVKTGEFGEEFPVVREWTTKPLKFAKRGDVLICVVGATVGKLNMAIDCAIGRSVAAIRPSPKLDSRYLYVVLVPFTLRLRSQSRGSAQGVIGKTELAQVEIRCPPLPEQHRIVAKVDELMALCDELEEKVGAGETAHAKLVETLLGTLTQSTDAADLAANWQRLAEHFDTLFTTESSLDALKQTFLQLAVMGKLVPQDLKDEPASETFAGLKSLDSVPEGVESVPNQWAFCQYRSLTSLVTSGSRGWKEFYSDTGAIFIRTQNIKTDNLVLDDVAFVNLPKQAEGMRAQVLQDDILITITGANVTKAARVESKIPEAYISQHIALTRPIWPKMSKWLHLCFISRGSARGILEKLAYGDKPGLSLANVRDLALPIPPLAEQHRIVAKVDELMALCNELKAKVGAGRTAQARLASTLIETSLEAA